MADLRTSSVDLIRKKASELQVGEFQWSWGTVTSIKQGVVKLEIRYDSNARNRYRPDAEVLVRKSD